MKLPSVMGLVLCNELGRDPQAGKPSLRGVINSWHFSVFPTPFQRFTVYVALYDGVGEGKLELSLMRLKGEKTLYRLRQWVILPGRMMPLIVVLKVKKCVFPAAGHYLFSLSFDNQELTRRYVQVFSL